MIRLHLFLNCDGCGKGVRIDTLDLGGNLAEVAAAIRGWAQDSKHPNDHYCPVCSEAPCRFSARVRRAGALVLCVLCVLSISL